MHERVVAPGDHQPVPQTRKHAAQATAAPSDLTWPALAARAGVPVPAAVWVCMLRMHARQLRFFIGPAASLSSPPRRLLLSKPASIRSRTAVRVSASAGTKPFATFPFPPSRPLLPCLETHFGAAALCFIPASMPPTERESPPEGDPRLRHQHSASSDQGSRALVPMCVVRPSSILRTHLSTPGPPCGAS